MLRNYALLEVVLLSLLFISPSIAQQHTISGYVKEKSSGEALIAANVYVKSSLKGTTTNTYGFFSLTLPQDTLILNVSYVGYTTVEYKLLLDHDVEVILNLMDLLT